jgi:hypothetical protein
LHHNAKITFLKLIFAAVCRTIATSFPSCSKHNLTEFRRIFSKRNTAADSWISRRGTRVKVFISKSFIRSLKKMSRKLCAALMIFLLQAFGLAVPLQAQERSRQHEKERAEKELNKIRSTQKPADETEDDDPDLPPGNRLSKGEYLRLREQQIALLRGFPYPEQDSRTKAIYEMARAEIRLRAERLNSPMANWIPLGPAPIPNGQTTGITTPVSGRVSAIAVHPTNPNIAYVGTAQGGLYRTLDGGNSWTPLLDGALSLAIGSVAIAPSDPTIVYVGTGESGFSLDSFFGVGVYRITNADSANPVVAGPLNRDASNNDVFSGRSVGKILVHPTDPNIIFVGTVSGIAGLGSATGYIFPNRGLYRSTNALSGNPTFSRLTVSTATADRPILDAVFEPGNPNRMFVALVDTTGNNDGGVYFTSNALDAAPVFARTNLTTGVGSNLGRAELAIQKSGDMVTVYCAHGTSNGTLSKAVYSSAAPGTPTFSVPGGGASFCSGQCFYDIAVEVDPTDANKVYLGGSPSLPFGRSINGGASFVTSANGLHVDTHAIAVAPSNPNTIYFGSDGGVWISTDGGTTWNSKNNSTFSATQFQSIAVHPVDRNFTLGGTQDNGTPFLFPDGVTWTRSVGGDGGFVAIDSNSTTPANTVSYHTFFNSTNSQIGFQVALSGGSNGVPTWGSFYGCGGVANGISCSDSTLFYAPMVLGPNAADSSNTNTVYFGTNKLYRSANRGVAMTPVSQTLSANVSAIGIARQDDNVRLIGTTTGRVYYSNTAGATTMNDITGTIPARYVGRIAIDPTNANVAYVALGGFGIPNQHVMKTTNLNAPTPTWTNAGAGIPDVPTNGLVIDPNNPNQLFAGTDIGVFRSIDGGATWTPFSDGLPRVAVFEITLQNANRVLRIATHGRGIWETPIPSINPSRKVRADFDGDGKTDYGVFRAGTWFIQKSTGGNLGIQWGQTGDQIVTGDYDGDGKADYAIYRPDSTNGTNLYVLRSGDLTYQGSNWGVSGDIARTGDFDGDGKTDIAIYRQSNNIYAALLSSGASPIIFQFGQVGDIPVVLDYDGDGKTDFAVFRPSNGVWYIRKSTDNSVASIQWGQAGDRLVPADYTGDGKDDLAVFRAGIWYVLSPNGQIISTSWGQTNDTPTPGDYDGDGKTDYAVFRNGTWFVLKSTGGFASVNFGQSGDIPVTAGYIP